MLELRMNLVLFDMLGTCFMSVLFCGSFLLFMFHVCLCYAVVYFPCSLVITCWEMADLLALLCVISCVFVTFPHGVLGQVWYLIVFIPDPCLLPYLSNVQQVRQSLYDDLDISQGGSFERFNHMLVLIDKKLLTFLSCFLLSRPIHPE